MIELHCDHCGALLDMRGNVVVDCGCSESERARAAAKERNKQFQTARKITFDEARQLRKRPLRDGNSDK